MSLKEYLCKEGRRGKTGKKEKRFDDSGSYH